jgi:biopolymer transport protein TolR
MMGMQLSGGNNRRRGGYRPMSDINVTPFVDVMLVLLIVFMVTAPLLTVGVPVELPESSTSALSDTTDPIVVTMKSDGEVYIQETPVPFEQLAGRLSQVTKQNINTRIYVRGDRNLNYGKIMQVMGCISEAGYSKVALVAEIPAVKTH